MSDNGLEKVIDLLSNQLDKVENKLDNNTKLTVELSVKLDQFPEHINKVMKQHELDYHTNDHAAQAWKVIYANKGKVALATIMTVIACVVPTQYLEKIFEVAKVFLIG